ncbi:MAG: TIGR03790 family protein [Armatimonadota bacterium]
MPFASQYRAITLLVLLLVLTGMAVAGGGPQNVLIVTNTRSSESLEIGNLYRRTRAIPYRQVFALTTSTEYAISNQTYLDEIETPIRTYLKNQQLENEISYIVLTRGVPQQVDIDRGRSVASLLAAMNLPRDAATSLVRVRNPYFNAPSAFTHLPSPWQGLYLVTVLNGFSTRDVASLITQGAAADGTAPAGRFLFQASQDIPRPLQTAAVDLLTFRGLQAEQLVAPPQDRNDVMGYLSGGIYSGLTKEVISSCKFRPGALADLAQNFSATAANFDENASPVLVPASWFVQAGVSGVHGVTGEAGLYSMPVVANPQSLFDHYTSGFSLAESYYTSLPFLNWHNIIFGDPLCTPYAQRPVVTIEGDTQSYKGIVPLRVTANSPTRGTTIRNIDMYLDDRYLQTLYEPDTLTITLRIGEQAGVSYTLPSDATLRMIIEGLAAAVNTNKELSAPGGVRAVPSIRTGTLQLIARTPGEKGDTLQASTSISEARPGTASLVARAEGNFLAGGGKRPTPAKATLSFVGRRILPGDVVELQIGKEPLSYTVPEGKVTLPALLDALVALIEASPTLKQPGGVHAYRDPQGMPFITLEARTPGERGNILPFRLQVKPAEGSSLRGYPDTPETLAGGHDGSASSLDIRFLLGDASVNTSYLLNTAALPDGYHRLRAVATDGTGAQVQGYKDFIFEVRNHRNEPGLKLPKKLGPVSDVVEVPITVDDALIKRVTVFIDGQAVKSSDAPQFTVTVPLAQFSRGMHDLWVEAADDQGTREVSAGIPLEVIAPAQVARILPDHTQRSGGTTHRLIGTGFQRGCTVRLAGTAVKSVTYISPSLLEVVSERGPARLGDVELKNPDGLAGTLAQAFEYYTPQVSTIEISPTNDVIAPGQKAQFIANCLDQFHHPLEARVEWSGDGISKSGIYKAPTQPGFYTIRAAHKDTKQVCEVKVTVGPAPVTDGRLRHWLVLGSFPDPNYAGLETSQIQENTVLPSHEEMKGSPTWQSLLSSSDYVNLAGRFSQSTDVVAYAHVYLYTEKDTPCSMVFGSDDGVRVWLNGDLQYSLRVRRAADPNQANIPITLKAGWNRLLVKVDQAQGGWGFYMRLQGRDGKPLTGLTYALDRPLPPPKK